MKRKPNKRHIISIWLLLAAAILGSRHDSYSESAPPKAGVPQVEPYVYVSGAVEKPGRYHWTQGMTVLDAAQAAGGFSVSARPKIEVIHIDGTSEVYTRRGTNAPTMLRPGDKISVPRRIL